MRVLFLFALCFIMFSCNNRENTDMVTLLEKPVICDICGSLIYLPEALDTTNIPVSKAIIESNNIQLQTPGFPSSPGIILSQICDDFVGVYLPINYINRLLSSRNHSYSMHLNESHDVLAVFNNRILQI